MTLDDVLTLAMILGLPTLLIGVVVANMTVFDMQKDLNSDLAEEDRSSPWFVMGKGAAVSKTVEKYRAKFGDDGPYRRLRFAYWLCRIGGTLVIVCSLVAKVASRLR
jgi:hypothetical protein